MLDISAVLDASVTGQPVGGLTIGQSRERRPVVGHVLGEGPRKVSLIGGCHADEPVGPAMLERLVALLERHPVDGPLLREFTLVVVPHVNPDGRARNASWTGALGKEAELSRAEPQSVFELASYLRHVVREGPGDDMEFGFPRGDDDDAARPENRAVAEFLRDHGPYVLHVSFHGMAFARGPWFLLEPSWIDRTARMREDLRLLVEQASYEVHDVDRKGEKGFVRIDRGFTTRPDSREMASHFERLGDPEMARRFRPSSMEFVKSLGQDPLTLVSEMPLFLLPEARLDVVSELRMLAESGEDEKVRREAERSSIRPMPIRDQMYFQLSYLDAALKLVR